jgi:hypothetical protein
MQWLIRFLIGGTVVSLFALVGDILRPKGFAGLFSAAPSVALATLALAIVRNGVPYAALEARSMLLGAIALLIYAVGCTCLLATGRFKAGRTSAAMLLVWATVAFLLRFMVLE